MKKADFKMIQIQNKQRIPVLCGTAFMSDEKNQTKIEVNQDKTHLILLMSTDSLEMIKQEEDYRVYALFSELKPTTLLMKHSFGSMQFEVRTKQWYVLEDVWHLEYELYEKGQLVDVYQFMIEIKECK